jgi:succinate dehydrogenase / fumarate reductase iron-sulfur subunit
MTERTSEPQSPAPQATKQLVGLRVLRQEGTEGTRKRWERFEVEVGPAATVADALSALERAPRTIDGKRVAPVAWEGDCLEGACGGCAMRVNGKVALACTTLVAPLAKKKPVVLEPLSRFATLTDLIVDRSPLFNALAQVEAATHVPERALGSVPAEHEAPLERLAGCMGCGACAEACPQYGPHSDFLGAAALGHAHRLNESPAGALQKSRRLDVLMTPGGIADCGKAQNCVEVCPAGVPLIDALTTLSRQTSLRFLFRWLGQ